MNRRRFLYLVVFAMFFGCELLNAAEEVANKELVLTDGAYYTLQNDILLHRIIPMYEERLIVVLDDFRDNKFRNIDYLDRFIKESRKANSEETCIILQDKKIETEKILNNVNLLIQDLANIYKSSKKIYDFLGKSEKFCKIFSDGLFLLNFKKTPSVWYNSFYDDIFDSKNIFFHELLNCVFGKNDLMVFLDDYFGAINKKKCFCLKKSRKRRNCDIFENSNKTLQNSIFFTYVFKRYFPLAALRSWDDFLDPNFLFYNSSLGFVERFIEKIDLDQSLSITKIHFDENQKNINHDFFIIKFLDNFFEVIKRNDDEKFKSLQINLANKLKDEFSKTDRRLFLFFLRKRKLFSENENEYENKSQNQIRFAKSILNLCKKRKILLEIANGIIY